MTITSGKVNYARELLLLNQKNPFREPLKLSALFLMVFLIVPSGTIYTSYFSLWDLIIKSYIFNTTDLWRERRAYNVSAPITFVFCCEYSIVYYKQSWTMCCIVLYECSALTVQALWSVYLDNLNFTFIQLSSY